MEADITAVDRGETVDQMQPMKVDDGSPRLAEIRDLAVDFVAKVAAFRSSLPQGIRGALTQLVRNVNCYYSNLIEGHDTHSIEPAANLCKSAYYPLSSCI